MKVTVVTNSYQRSQALVERSLSASLKLIPPIRELIFIDQNTTPLPLSEEIQNDPRFKRVMSSSKCVSEARNQAPIDETSDWVVFCDDDGFFDADYVNQLANFTHHHPKCQIIAGSIVRDDNGAFYSPRHRFGGDMMKFKFTKLLMGSNFAARPSTFNTLGRFDVNFGAGSYWGSGEETDFAWKAFFAKTEMHFEPKLIVYHVKPYAESLSHSIKKSFRYGRGKGALVMKWLMRGQILVLIEFAEMFAVPLVQIVFSAVTLKFKNIPIYLSTITGRTWGLFAYALNLLSKKADT